MKLWSALFPKHRERHELAEQVRKAQGEQAVKLMKTDRELHRLEELMQDMLDESRKRLGRDA